MGKVLEIKKSQQLVYAPQREILKVSTLSSTSGER
jgi:hypothetical protein